MTMRNARRVLREDYKGRSIKLTNITRDRLPAIKVEINGGFVWTYDGRDHAKVLEQVKCDVDHYDADPRVCCEAHWYPSDDPRNAARLAHLEGELRLERDGTIPALWLAGWHVHVQLKRRA